MELNCILAILNRDRCTAMEEVFQSLRLPLALTMMCRGTATTEHLSLYGLLPTQKALLTTVADGEQTRRLMRAAKLKLFIDIPGNGIMMSVPIKSIGGGRTMAYLTDRQNPGGEKPALQFDHELIYVILNEGCSDLVMAAARSAGATGGTVLHGKGTGSQNKKFYNVSIAAEQEVILMVAPSDRKAAIMQSVLHHAGPDSDAGAVLFSLPVSEVAGFGLLDEAAE